MLTRDNRVNVVVYVDGQRNDFDFAVHESVQSVIAQVVARMRLNRPPTDYEMRWFESGNLLDAKSSLEESGVREGSALVLGPKAGIGG